MINLTVVDTFQTERVFAERLRDYQFDQLYEMHQDAGVMGTLGGLRSAEQTRSYLNENLAHWERHGYGLWIFRSAEDNRFAGRGGIRHIRIAGNAEVEIAYALTVEFWGRGLATEIARHLVGMAFTVFQIDEIVAFTSKGNVGSRRVMEKAGLRFDREFMYAEEPHLLYRLRRDEHGTA